MEETENRGTLSEEQEAEGAEARMGEELKQLLQKDVRLQSQFDRAVSKALNKARANWERSAEEGNTPEEESREWEQRFQQREQALALRERRAKAAMALGEHGLPGELADCLDLADEEQAQQNVERLKEAFAQSVSKAVEERLKGSPPKGSGEAVYASRMRAALGLK